MVKLSLVIGTFGVLYPMGFLFVCFCMYGDSILAGVVPVEGSIGTQHSPVVCAMGSDGAPGHQSISVAKFSLIVIVYAWDASCSASNHLN